MSHHASQPNPSSNPSTWAPHLCSVPSSLPQGKLINRAVCCFSLVFSSEWEGDAWLLFYCCEKTPPTTKDTMTFYERKHLIRGLFITLKDEYVTIIKGSMAVGRQAWSLGSSWEFTFDLQAGDRERYWARYGILKPQSPTPETPFPTGPYP